MNITKQTINAKSHKLSARWTMEHVTWWPEIYTDTKTCNSVTEAIFRKLYEKVKRKFSRELTSMHGLDVEEELTNIMAQEISREIDKEILQEIKKTMQVPKEIL